MNILSSNLSNELNILLGICALIVLFGLLLKRINQPYIIAYILTGILLGPFGFKLITEQETVEVIGEFGLIVLMFFIGMEIDLRDFLGKWRVALFGTGFQILFSIGMMVLLGLQLDWPFKRMLLLGFIISLSSSAVVIKLIEDLKIGKTLVGQNVISILLTQDIAIVPMIIIMSFLESGAMSTNEIFLQLMGGVIILFLLIYLLKKKYVKIPFEAALRNDHELQVFGSLIICFGLALFTSLFQLSAGLGAFIAGLLMHSSPATRWLHDSLHSFRVLLISVFFLSIGMMIDLNFFIENWIVITILVFGVYLSNHGINTFSLRLLGNSWKESFYGGSLLSQVGEFSFVLASLGYHSNIMTQYTYQLSVIVISITIFISPIYVVMSKGILRLDIKSLPKSMK